MEKNTIWAIVLSSIVLIGSMLIQNHFFPPQKVVTTEQEVVISEELQTLPEQTKEVVTQVVEYTSDSIPEEEITINTGKAEITLTNKGGDIISYELLDHKDKDGYVQMADSISEMNRACSISFGNAVNSIINENFKVTKYNDLSYAFSKEFTVKNIDGSSSTFVLSKKYTFKENDYLFKLDVTVDGNDQMEYLDFSNSAYTLRTSPQIGPYFDRKKDKYENRTFMSYAGNKAKRQVLGNNQMRTFDKKYLWTGVAGKYFTFLVVPESSGAMGDVVYSTQLDQNNYANAQVMLTRHPILKNNVTDTYYIYVGPRTEKDLRVYNKSTDNEWKVSDLRLNDSLTTSGLLSWLEVAMKWIMEMIYKVIPNWGVAIIIMTILLRLIIYPLTKKSSESSLKMQEFQPKIQEIQTKYKENPQKMNEEMAKLYKETGYNPLSGCLPLLIQFPLIIAMFNLFNNYFEFRGAMFIPGWIPDLSVGDSVASLNFNLPLLGNQIRILPVIYLVSQLFYGKMTSATTPTQNASQMKFMMYGMPIIFFFIFYNSPSGLLLYWTVSNILTMVQQIYINKLMQAKKAEMEKAKANEIPVFVPKKKKK